jgi:hypothetical protein
VIGVSFRLWGFMGRIFLVEVVELIMGFCLEISRLVEIL